MFSVEFAAGMILSALTAHRLWRLVGADSLTQFVRDRLPAPVASFLACPWCAGFWTALIVWGSFYLWGHHNIWWWVTGLFALSSLIGFLSRIGESTQIEVIPIAPVVIVDGDNPALGDNIDQALADFDSDSGKDQ